MTDPNRAKTNWRLFFLQLAFLWMVAFVLLAVSPLPESPGGGPARLLHALGYATVLLPLLAIPVILLHAIVGTVQQDRLNTARDRRDAEEVFGKATACSMCGRSGCRLEIIDYEYLVFLVVFWVQRRVIGKLCRKCAVSALNTAFLTNVFGCILIPPLIPVAWYKRHIALRKYGKEERTTNPMHGTP